MAVSVELHNTGDPAVGREVQALVEHAPSDRAGDWRVPSLELPVGYFHVHTCYLRFGAEGVCPARNLVNADSFGASTDILARSEGVMPKRAESETIWHISDDLSIWPARILVIRRTRSSNVLRSELKATPGSTCLATSRQTTFSSGDNHFGG